jgi:hypothetical protein
MQFKEGDRVKWTSQAQGSTKTKVGTIVQVVSPKGRLHKEHRDFGLVGHGLPRPMESYVVHVNGKTEASKGKRFWPHVSALKPAGRVVSQASAVLYPAIEAAMKEMDEHCPPGQNPAVDRAYDILHGAFWSECPAPASAAPLRSVAVEV